MSTKITVVIERTGKDTETITFQQSEEVDEKKLWATFKAWMRYMLEALP